MDVSVLEVFQRFHRPAGCRRSASNIARCVLTSESKGCGTHTPGASGCKGIFVIYELLPLSLTRMPVHARDWINTHLNNIFFCFFF